MGSWATCPNVSVHTGQKVSGWVEPLTFSVHFKEMFNALNIIYKTMLL